MAPAKKSKSVNKGFAVPTNSPNKDEKSKQKKRKLPNLLGPQWSKHELERFYEAYRKYGKDWKKIASVVRARSTDMVEALYNMNRAYLSLPEGTASVVGLIAMMTDHYNVMGGSGSERDNDEPTAQKLQKYPKAKVRFQSPKEESFQRQPSGPSNRCLSLLKMHSGGIQPYFPVRKRTPRVPVSCLDVRPNKKSRGSLMNASHDEISRGAFWLAEERQRPSPPHVSQAISRETELWHSSQVSARAKVHKYRGAVVDEDAEGSLGSNEAKNVDLVRNSVDSDGNAFAEYKKRRKKAKKGEVEVTDTEPFNGIWDAYSHDGRGQQEKIGSQGAGTETHRPTSEMQNKRNEEPSAEDERAAYDALQTLAEMSLMMPYLADDSVDNGGETMVGRKAHSDVRLKDESAGGEHKKKRKSQASKVRKAELHTDSSRKSAKNETLIDEQVKSADSNGQISTISRICKTSVRSPDVSSSNDRPMRDAEVAVSSTQVEPASQVVNPTRRKKIRKRDRMLVQKDINCGQSNGSGECSSFLQDRVQCVKDTISNCLSSHDVHRWCAYEWFYSAIDYPWFAKREFVEYLNHVRLGHIPRLTRVEWGVIRSSLGKPRRFSERFLQEERVKLEQYRESVRSHYAKLRAGLGEGLPTDLARPLSVGQQVVAIHPKTREVHDGSVLSVDHHNCLVQFTRPDLGVEVVMDIECMPLSMLENMPEALRRQKMLHNLQYSLEPKVNGNITLVPEEHMLNLDSQMQFSPSNPSLRYETKFKPSSMSSHAKVIGSGSLEALSAAQTQSCNRAALRPISGLTLSLDRKVLEQYSTHPVKPACWPQPLVNSAGLHGTTHSSNNSMFSCQESASNVAAIVGGSRDKAQKMVDIAVKVMSSMKEGEDAYGSIGDALDTTNKAERAAFKQSSMTTSSNTVHGNLSAQNAITPCIPETLLKGDASVTKSVGSPSSDLQVPSDLITSCVATLLMIQTCTERQYPPADVAQILDNAVTSLHPSCSQNISVYRDIQMCMGRIKTQILALVPT